MFFSKLIRCSNKVKAQYSRQAQEYLNSNSLLIVQKICDGVLGSEKLEEEKVRELLGNNYPIAPWVEETDIIGQFVCLLEEAGYIFVRDTNGEVKFKNEDMYKAIVQNHLKLSGMCIMERLAYYCEKTKGRLDYEQVEEVLGFHYPKAPYIGKMDKRVSIIMFLKATGIPFKFNETHVYFP